MPRLSTQGAPRLVGRAGSSSAQAERAHQGGEGWLSVLQHGRMLQPLLSPGSSRSQHGAGRRGGEPQAVAGSWREGWREGGQWQGPDARLLLHHHHQPRGGEPVPHGQIHLLPPPRCKPTSRGVWTPRKHPSPHAHKQAEAHPFPPSQCQTLLGAAKTRKAPSEEGNPNRTGTEYKGMAYSSFSFSSSSLSSPGQPSTQSALRSC